MEFLNAKIVGFILILARVGAFFGSAPVFSWKTIPMQIKTATAVVLTIFIAGMTPLPGAVRELNILEMIILVLREMVYGISLGLISWMLFVAVKICGEIIERQMGLMMAAEMDPTTGEQSAVLGILIEVLFILLFFAVDGHHLLLMTLTKSYDTFALGSVPNIALLTESIIFAGSTMLLLALKLAGPILAAFLLMMVVLAIMARIAPEMNILFLSLPLRTGLGITLVGLFVPFILGFVRHFDVLLDKLLPL